MKTISITDVIEFNKKYKVEDTIKYTDENGVLQTAKVRYHAEQIDGGSFVVWVHGRYDAVKLENVVY